MREAKAGLFSTLVFPMLAAGCASFNPRPPEEVGFERRTLSKTDGGLKVSTVALSEDEAKGAMGVGFARRGIQPVWIKNQAITYQKTEIERWARAKMRLQNSSVRTPNLLRELFCVANAMSVHY